MYLPVCNGALAETLEKQEINLDIGHSLEDNAYTSGVSLLEEQAVLQPDILEEYISMDGVYYGNMIPASTIDLGINQKADIITWITLDPNVLSSGCSDYWLRLPLDGTRIESFSLSIDYLYPFGRGADASPLYNIGDFSRLKWTQDGILININQHILSTTYKLWKDNYPAGFPDEIAEYADRERYEFRLGIEDITPKRDYSIRLLVTEEDYTQNDTITMDIGATEVTKQLYGCKLAWSFVFLSGCPATTLYSSDSGTSIFGITQYVGGGSPFNIGDYVTVMLPFYGTNIDWSVYLYVDYTIAPETDEKGWSIDWSTTVTDSFLYQGLKGLVTGEEIHYTLETEESLTADYTLSFSDVTNILAFTVPLQINASWNNFSMVFVPSEPVEMFFARTPTKAFEYNLTFEPAIPRVTFMDYSYGIRNTFDSNLFITVEPTSGLYATVTWTSDYVIYDFGYTKGYQYPGEVDIWVTLDNETEIYFSGNIGLLYDELLTMKQGFIQPEKAGVVNTFLNSLYYQILNGVQGIKDTISGTIETLFSYITGFLNWLGRFVIDLVGKIIAWLQEFVQYLGNIIKGVFMIAPLWVVLMVSRFGLNPAETIKGVKEEIAEVKQEIKIDRYARKLDEVQKAKLIRKKKRIEKKKNGGGRE
jgi:hypothetical protein